MYKFLFLLALVVSFNSVSSNMYECTINETYTLSKDGYIQEDELYRYKKGKTFFVDRDSGITTGYINNKYTNVEPIVIDKGGEDSSFKVITVVQTSITSYIQNLLIQEYNKSNKKPFIFMWDNIQHVGLCQYL